MSPKTSLRRPKSLRLVVSDRGEHEPAILCSAAYTACGFSGEGG